VHPIEQLRHVARADGAAAVTVAVEAAHALRTLDATTLVVSCRQIVRRHPANGPLWWVCSHLLASTGQRDRGRDLARALDADATTSVLRRALSGHERVLATGWSSTLIEAVRGDVAVVVAGSGRDTSSMVRALRRRDVDVEQIAMEEAAVVMADGVDAVIVDAHLVTVSRVTAPVGSTVLASVAAVVDVPLWLVASRGTRLPESYRATIDAMLAEASTRSLFDSFDVATAALIVGPDGASACPPAALAPECAAMSELVVSPR